jgi:site-specific recombinase XerD
VSDDLDALAASFRRHLRAEGKSDRTAAIYLQSVRFFGRWCREEGDEPTVESLTRNRIRNWLSSLAENGLAPGTLRTRWKGLHRFCGWLVAEGELAAHPMAGLDVPMVPETPVPILTDDQLAALLKTCAGRAFTDRRDEAILRMLIDCGVRVSELCGLSLADVDLDSETAFVIGKGRKRRAVYFSARTSRAVDRYVRERRRHRWAHLDTLWLTQRGGMSPDAVRDMVKTRGHEAGLGDGVHPHRFRHSFAHDFLLAGGGERDLKRLAGWSSDAMLERYGASAADMRAREAARRLRRGDRI